MKILKTITIMLFALSISAQSVMNVTYLDVPLNKVNDFVTVHEKVVNMATGEGRTTGNHWVYRHWYGSDHSLMLVDIYSDAVNFVKDDFWGVLRTNIDALPEDQKKEMQEAVAKWWGYHNNHTDEVRSVDWEGNWYGKENLNLDIPYVFVIGSYNTSGGNQEMIDAYFDWLVKPGVDDGVMMYGGATTHYIGSGSEVQLWGAYSNINDFAKSASEGPNNSEAAPKFWNLVEGAHSDQIYIHVGNTLGNEGKFNRAGPDN